jgi:hypothetical protein
MKKLISNKILINDGNFNAIDIKRLKKEHKIKRSAILIYCNNCNRRKYLIVPHSVIESCRSLARVLIPKGILCEHSLIAYIDKNFDVRSCEIADYELSVDSIYQFPKN